MTNRFLLDTDIIIDFLRGKTEAVNYVKTFVNNTVISTISVAELYAGVRGSTERKELDDFLGLFPIIPVSFEIAQMGGLYKQEYFKSHGIGLADAIIAATAYKNLLEIKTLNIKHFPMFKNLKPPYKKRGINE